MENINRVLKRQIRKTFGKDFVAEGKLKELLLKVSSTYDDFENDRKLLERSIDISSEELIYTNSSLMKQKEELVKANNVLKKAQERLQQTEHIQALYTELKSVNKALQEKNIQLERTYDDLRETQAQLIHNEKMVVLGQLISGIAHEINTPLSVINGASDGVAELISDFTCLAPKTISGIPQSIVLDFFEVLKRDSNVLSTSEERRYRKVICNRLEKLGITKPQRIARDLVKAGLHTSLNQFKHLVNENNSEDLLAVAILIGRVFSNIQKMKLASEKMKKIIFSLKGYSRQQDANSKEFIDIIENIELVLTLYQNSLKHGVLLEKEYMKSPPTFIGYPDELNQVWTNLIHNAIHAMESYGKLKIEIKQINNDIVVNFANDGKEIPANIKKKIFDPLFTTKAKGEGTGLGLSICKKIIAKHNGEISVKSNSQWTVFTVKLPITHKILD